MNYLISIVLGAILGSFANVCIARLPEAQSVVRPRSRCPHCLVPIRYYDNIPVLSYIVLRGKCRNCRAHISLQYPFIEILVAVLFLLNAWIFHENLVKCLFCDTLALYLVIISAIDFHLRIIPDELSLSLLALGLCAAVVNPFLPGPPLHRLLESFLAALTGFLFSYALAWAGDKIFRKESFGGGDIKLITAFGAVLGWTGLVGSLFIGSLLGALIGGFLILIGRKKRHDYIPFGPFLAIGMYLTCLTPPGWLDRIFP
jgi:leader peptidase (prepilin peptidase) / N-methyltransferase